MIASAVHRAINRHGVAATLRRLTATGGLPVMQDVAVRAVWRHDRQDVLADEMHQSERTAIVAESDLAGWPGPPRKDDVLIVGGELYTVTHSDPRHERGAVVAHHLKVKA